MRRKSDPFLIENLAGDQAIDSQAWCSSQRLTSLYPIDERNLVGASHAQHVSRRDAVANHVRDAEGDDACLARARAGEDQHWAANGFSGQALLRIERVQIHHRARSLKCHKMNASAQGKF